jgi:oligosaccharyltransferase complex subunit epsilon
MTDAFKEVFVKVKAEYTKSQTMKTKMIDAFLVYCLATCGVQILYVFVAGSYPFNSFLSGLLCHVCMFACAASLRYQLTSPEDFKSVTPERALGDFVFTCLVLFFIVFSFMG